MTRSRLAIPSAGDLVAAHARPSPQDAFGEALARLADVDGVGRRLVTASSAGAGSSSSSGLVGRHIELSESETNLFTLLGRLGSALEQHGELLLPVGIALNDKGPTGLDALVHAVRSGARFVLVETTVGADIPGLRRCQPTFAAEVDWMLCDALERLSAADGGSTQLRLSAAPIDQEPFAATLDRLGRRELRRLVLAGGYRLIEPSSVRGPSVTLVATGSVIADIVAAADELETEGIATTVVHLTSPDLVRERWQQMFSEAAFRGRRPTGTSHIEDLISGQRGPGPIVSVHDGARDALSWIGGAVGGSQIPLDAELMAGSDEKGLYRASGISRAHVVNAALLAVDLFG